MDIHKPKPWHGLREFLKEYAIIVIGVLTALSAEQTAEWLHWQHEVAEGRERLHKEIEFDERVYQHRADVAACVQRNLASLNVVIASLQSKTGRINRVPPFISPQNGPVDHEVWNTLSAAQVLVHFPKDELEKYSRFYQQREDDEYFMDRELRAWRQLHLLEGDPRGLSPQDVSALRTAAGDAAEMGAGLESVSRSQVRLGRALGVRLPQSDPSWPDECKPVTPG